MADSSQYKQGSTWRRWDLHVHAPSTYTLAKADNFLGNSPEDKFDKYIEDLKKLKDISVIGITDYFSLEGYEKVIAHKNSLKNIDLIIQNI